MIMSFILLTEPCLTSSLFHFLQKSARDLVNVSTVKCTHLNYSGIPDYFNLHQK